MIKDFEQRYYTYVLRCEDSSLYFGITTDIERRMREHFSGGNKCAKYTRVHKPKKLECVWSSANRATASRLEYRGKQLTKANKEKLVKCKDLSLIFHDKISVREYTLVKTEDFNKIGEIMSEDIKFMKLAINLSKQAVEHGNEPFGAVLVKDGEVVFTSENKIYTNKDYTSHAEIELIRKFSRSTGVTDLSDYTLYSSCEPCFMCSGAMVWAKLGRLVYAASDMDLCEILGVKGSECVKTVFENSHSATQVTSGVLKEESLRVLCDYFNNHIKN